jgi:hypothetical protein
MPLSEIEILATAISGIPLYPFFSTNNDILDAALVKL